MNPENDYSLTEPELRGELAHLRSSMLTVEEVRITLTAFALWLGVCKEGEQVALVDQFIRETT